MSQTLRSSNGTIIGRIVMEGRKQKVYDFNNRYRGWTENEKTYSVSGGLIAHSALPALLLV